MGKMRSLKALGLLAAVGLIAIDLASARKQPPEIAPDAYFEAVDAVSAAPIATRVAIVRSDNDQLSEPVPVTEPLTRSQIRDMVYAALQTDQDWDSGRPRLAEKIAQTRLERDSCWVVVKSNMIGYPGRALYT